MTETVAVRPDPSVVAPYHRQYVDQVPDGDIVATLAAQRAVIAALAGRESAWGGRRYEPGKWTVTEVLGHSLETERIFSHRALCVARDDGAGMAGFDQDAWVVEGAFAARTLADVVDEWCAVRDATVQLYRNLPEVAWDRAGDADGKPVTVRGLAWLTAGHATHHLRVLEERYG